ncbi:MAG: type II toxin-antitoxin system VapB family antitoxin [Bryobacteraceae bacterium]
MRTTIDLREDLLEEARELTGIQEKTALLHAGLQLLVERENARRLIALGGTMPNLKPVSRRRAATT